MKFKKYLVFSLVILVLLLGSSHLSYYSSSNTAGTNVIITEVLYDTPGTDSVEEWVELYNPTANTISLSGWTISDNAGTFSLSGSIAPFGFLVLARDAAGFNALYGFNPDVVMGSAIALSNSGDQLVLKDNTGQQVDFVAWENYVSGWSVSAVHTTIYRPSATDTDTVSDWADSGSLGTPGSGNYGGGVDTTPPVVTIINPSNTSVVSGTTVVSIGATDSSGITSYEILIDGVLRSTSTSYSWDTTTYSDGSHTITARAQDGAGNWGETIHVVTVNNTLPPSPSPSTGAYKVMLYNIEASGANADWKQVVKEENPDLVVFVETGTWDDNNNALLNQYVDEFNAYFVNEAPYQGVVTQGISFSTSGEAVMSRFPILSTNQLPTVTLDDGTVYDVSHDFFEVVVDIDGTAVHVIAGHLKCCSGATNEDKRERAQEGIINYIDSLGNVPVLYLADFNSFSPQDVGPLAPKGDLGYGPMSMMLKDDTFGAYSQYGSTLNNFTDVFRTLNPNDPGYTYGHQNPTYESRIDFILVNQYFDGLLINSTVGDTPTANTGSDHYAVDVFLNPFGTTDTTPPSQVTGLTATSVSDTQIDLTWDPSGATDLDHYNIYRDGVLIGQSTTNSFSDTSLTPSTTYTYEVSAVDTSGNEGAKSSPVSATTLAPADTTPPAQVTGLTASAVSGSQIDLSWTPSTEPDFSHYNIYRDGVFIAQTTTSSFSDTGLASETTYTYEVSAVDTSGNEGLRSTPASATTFDVTPPPQVTGLTASAVSGSQIDLTWTASSAQDLSYYNIYRDGILIATTVNTTFSDTGLSSQTTYTYQVSAVDTSGNEGQLSSSASATTWDITAPGQVTGLSVGTVTDTQITLSWNANPEPDVASYNIYRDGTLIATVSTTSFTDSGLSPSTTYTYEVSAVDTSGNEGQLSSPVSATTAPPPGIGHLLISEVYYDATGTDSQREWIEIYNPTSQIIDLTGYWLQDAAGGTFTLSGLINPGEFLIVARNMNGFLSFYGFSADLGDFTFALSNTGDWVKLFDANGNEVDFVAWENKVPGWGITARTGESIARIDLTVDTDTVSDWTIIGNDGTPGS